MTRRQSGYAMVWLVAVGLVGGCGASLRSVTAEQINCPTTSTEITNTHNEMDREMWTARCHGSNRQYACSQGKSGDDQVRCEPMSANH